VRAPSANSKSARRRRVGRLGGRRVRHSTSCRDEWAVTSAHRHLERRIVADRFDFGPSNASRHPSFDTDESHASRGRHSRARNEKVLLRVRKAKRPHWNVTPIARRSESDSRRAFGRRPLEDRLVRHRHAGRAWRHRPRDSLADPGQNGFSTDSRWRRTSSACRDPRPWAYAPGAHDQREESQWPRASLPVRNISPRRAPASRGDPKVPSSRSMLVTTFAPLQSLGSLRGKRFVALG
jgi:hypothetical protein